MLREGLQVVATRLLGRGLIDYLPGCGSASGPFSLPPGPRFAGSVWFGSHLHPSFKQRILICKFYPLINACLFLSSELVWDSFFKCTITLPSLGAQCGFELPALCLLSINIHICISHLTLLTCWTKASSLLTNSNKTYSQHT